jgi:hypothetical protein
MNCLSYPTAFRPPGWVYQVSNRNGDPSTFLDLSSTPGVKVIEASFPDVAANVNNKTNASVIASLLGFPLKASADTNHLYSVSQTFQDVTQTDMDQPSYENLQDAFYASPQLAKDIKNGTAAGYKYYLVRNALKAKQVTYTFDRDIGADVDVTVTPAQVGNIEAKAGFDDKGGLKYSKTFNSPQEVCIQVDPLPVQVPTHAGGPAAAPSSSPLRRWSSGPGDAPLFMPAK